MPDAQDPQSLLAQKTATQPEARSASGPRIEAREMGRSCRMGMRTEQPRTIAGTHTTVPGFGGQAVCPSAFSRPVFPHGTYIDPSNLRTLLHFPVFPFIDILGFLCLAQRFSAQRASHSLLSGGSHWYGKSGTRINEKSADAQRLSHFLRVLATPRETDWLCGGPCPAPARLIITSIQTMRYSLWQLSRNP